MKDPVKKMNRVEGENQCLAPFQFAFKIIIRGEKVMQEVNFQTGTAFLCKTCTLHDADPAYAVIGKQDLACSEP